MAKPPTSISKKGARGVGSLIFVASFLLSALLALGSMSVSRIYGTRTRLLASGQPLLPYYLSVRGFLTLLPLDILLLAYTVCVILVVITLRILAQAQLTAEENPQHAQKLAAKAEKYIERTLNGVVFFMAFEFLTTLNSVYILFEDNFWPAIALCAAIAYFARYLMHRVINPSN